MNKKKIIATFLLSANLFGSAFFSNTSAFQISTSGYNNENVKVQTENDPELTFFALAKGLNQKYDSLPAQDKGFFKIETLDLKEVSDIEENFFKLFIEFLSENKSIGCANIFIANHKKFEKFYNALVALDNDKIEILLSDKMVNKIISNAETYGISKLDIDGKTITLQRKTLIERKQRSKNQSYIQWKKSGLDKKLLKEYNENNSGKFGAKKTFAEDFIKNYINDISSATTIANGNELNGKIPRPNAVVTKLNLLLKEQPTEYKDGSVKYKSSSNKMIINATEKSRKEKKPKKPTSSSVFRRSNP